ncbi:zinc-binding dehydrogenase [Alteribacillus bidgolensis]|uniref:NADPH:quinone reductase n=1 Tax=Alteribacillus bidgolensis TaxID=930129 RepID=A0A1G8EE15_9BACI|nr:NADPH:quinone reductase [Alteribacillus bidgolensis]
MGRNGLLQSIPSKMKAVAVTEYGGVEKLEERKVPVPIPKENEVLVKIYACALNNSDILLREGGYGTDTKSSEKAGWKREAISFPRIPGTDVAGQIVDVGANINPACVGEKVVLFPFISSAPDGVEHMADDITLMSSECDGGYAEYITWPKELCRAMPLSSYVESSSFIVSCFTAWHMLEKSNVVPGEKILITGATGGVGSYAVQIASKVFGADVIALVRDLSLKEKMIELGASEVLSYKSTTLPDDVIKAADGKVDVVLDVVGDPLFSTCLKVLRNGGRLATSGAASGAVTQLDIRTVYLKHLSIIGCTLGTRKEFDQMLDVIREEKIKPLIDKVFPLEKARDAQEYFKRSEKFGKVILQNKPKD